MQTCDRHDDELRVVSQNHYTSPIRIAWTRFINVLERARGIITENNKAFSSCNIADVSRLYLLNEPCVITTIGRRWPRQKCDKYHSNRRNPRFFSPRFTRLESFFTSFLFVFFILFFRFSRSRRFPVPVFLHWMLNVVILSQAEMSEKWEEAIVHV